MLKFLSATLVIFGLTNPFALAQDAKKSESKAAAKKEDVKKDDKKVDKKAAKGDSCTFALTGNDQMKFGILVDGTPQPLTDLKVPKSCLKEKITITLQHVGTLPKEVMGHNVVVTLASTQQEVIKKYAMAGAAKGYVDDNYKEGVIGHTDTIGGGQKTSKDLVIAPNTLKEKEGYAFFCSFPGHAGLMSGKIQFVDDPAKS